MNKELEAKGYTPEDEAYLRAFADGFIDGLDVAGIVELEDRQASPLRDAARQSAVKALLKAGDLAQARAIVSDPFEEDFDLGGEG